MQRATVYLALRRMGNFRASKRETGKGHDAFKMPSQWFRLNLRQKLRADLGGTEGMKVV